MPIKNCVDEHQLFQPKMISKLVSIEYAKDCDPKIRFLYQRVSSGGRAQTHRQTRKWKQRTHFQGFRNWLIFPTTNHQGAVQKGYRDRPRTFLKHRIGVLPMKHIRCSAMIRLILPTAPCDRLSKLEDSVKVCPEIHKPRIEGHSVELSAWVDRFMSINSANVQASVSEKGTMMIACWDIIDCHRESDHFNVKPCLKHHDLVWIVGSYLWVSASSQHANIQLFFLTICRFL